MGVFILLTILVVFAKAQSPQDVAYQACSSTTSIYEMTAVDGYIESIGYPNANYADNEDCQWYLNPTGGIPVGSELFLEVEYFQTESCCDEVYVYEGEGIYGDLKFELAGTISSGQFYSLGNDPVTLWFETDSSVDYDGFRLHYYVAEQSPGQVIADQACDGDTRPVTLRNSTLILESPSYPTAYPSNTLCEWIITPDNVVNGLYINVLYFYAYDYLYVFFDDVIDDDHDTYLYGSYYAGYTVYVPNNRMALQFQGTYTDPGFQLIYYQADEACTSGSATVLDVGEKAELKSPGYPYDVPEHLRCRWLLQAPAGQKVLLTSLALDLFGVGPDCTDEYVEVLDGNTIDALSLGLFCGNMTFGTIPSTSDALQVYLHTRAESTGSERTGFRFEYEAA